MSVDAKDWRLGLAPDQLKGATLKWLPYKKYREGWDHDHCSFCTKKFMEAGTPDVLHEGYATEDQYYWVCETCFNDFKDLFSLKVRER